MTVPNLTVTEDPFAKLLQEAVDDTDDAPWMTMPEFQFRLIQLLLGILDLHARRQGLGWHVTGELGVRMPKPGAADMLTLGPDLFVVEADRGLRTTWDIPAEGQPPRFVLEVVTQDSVQRDTAPDQKVGYYAAMGVEEYAIYWPERRSEGPKLFGYRRDDAGRWVLWSTDAQDVLWSRALGGLGLTVAEVPWLQVVDQHGNVLPSLDEEADRAEREAERAEREAERAALLEAEVARLRAMLEGRADER
jgi:Uma2 family endonuclease